MVERYVLLGLAPARAGWFQAVSRWAMSATIAAEFVKCVSAEEVRSRLASGRPWSALIVDGSLAAFDRDLVDASVAVGTPVILVRPERGGGPAARDLGASAELPADFSPAELVEALTLHSRAVPTATAVPPTVQTADGLGPWAAPLYVVCGAGGTGASTVAAALAQGFARDPRHGRLVLLADLALRADQAMLHDCAELGPGLQELVEQHRTGRPPAEELIRYTFEVPSRGYHLLLGLRQPQAWAALRPRAIDAATAGIRRCFRAVVADVTGDVEGEEESGSSDVEERNHLARSSVRSSTVTVAVGAPGVKGVHSLARLIASLVRAGAQPERVVAVINRSPRHPAARAESSRALGRLLEGSGVRLALAAPVHLPDRKIEPVLRDTSPLPGALVDPVTRAVLAVADRVADAPPQPTGFERVRPGSLGSWSEV